MVPLRQAFCLLAVLVCSLMTAVGMAESFQVRSPDDKNVLTLTQSGPDSGIQYAIARNGQTLVGPSRLSLRLATHGSITDKLKIAGVERGRTRRNVRFALGQVPHGAQSMPLAASAAELRRDRMGTRSAGL